MMYIHTHPFSRFLSQTRIHTNTPLRTPVLIKLRAHSYVTHTSALPPTVCSLVKPL